MRISASRLGSLLGDDRGDGPAYLWIADGIRAAVADGRVMHGMRLPGERELAPALAVSRTTITKAYSVLAERGYAQAKQGSGTTVVLPGGRPDEGDAEPLDDRPADPRLLNLVQAAPPATPGLQAAFETALEQLPRFTTGRGYYSLGIPELREAIAQRFVDRGVATSADQIVVTAGASSAVGIVLTALTEPRAAVVLESPGYPNTVQAVRGTGRRPVGVPVGDLAAHDEALARAKTCLVVLDFQNPTGGLADDEHRAQLARIWTRRGTTPIIDETLVETWLDDEPQVRPMAAHHPGAITIGSASKTHWGGMRLGWIRAPRHLVGALSAARRSFDLGSPVLEQLALDELLRTRPGLHPEMRRMLRGSRDRLWEFGIGCGWEATRPHGGLSIWWRLPRPRGAALATAAEREGLLMLPGAAFAVDGRGLDSFLRTPFTLRPEDIDRVLPALRAAAERTGLSG